MQISVEISLYPLTQVYEEPILEFIAALNKFQGLTINTNNMSTQITGEYDLVMGALTECLKKTFEDPTTSIGVIKILNKPVEI